MSENSYLQPTKVSKFIYSPHFGLVGPRAEENNRKHVSCLFPELLTLIFSFLDLSDKGKVGQVCTSWRDAAYNKQVWKNVEAKLHLRHEVPSLIPSLVRRGIKKIQVLSLRKNKKSFSKESLSSFESINLSGCFKLTDANFRCFLNYGELLSLTSLNLSLCKQITDNTLTTVSIYLKNLEFLDIGGCSNITGSGIYSLSSSLKNLKHLNLRSLRYLTDECIESITGKGQLSISGLAQLEKLVLHDCQKISDSALLTISLGLKNLKCLNLNFCFNITAIGLSYIAKMTELQELYLRLCINVGDLGIGYLASGNMKLHTLDISFCEYVTDQSLAYISQGIFHLKSLGLSACAISDVGISYLVKTVTNLKVLYLGQCNKLTDKSLDVISKQLINLEVIDLYGCTKIKRKAVETLSSMPRLKQIKMDI
ncbi:hypothetical protein HELRODRAFT_65174 [Helobdella robusta]|uniref:F-box domain-containing protein n=1 Tax=Helobdella robusta TaxID=6412 RepID=T1FY42_HELRO|nr:hypothetical protein HELRODRAFT_65174 [Helobdella robusta]ESO02302.1 hypothetical protein HELRODRAFT_65174 [Helobdella robusta]